MKTHEDIDRRSLAMGRAIVAAIDKDPRRKGLYKARRTCARWHHATGGSGVDEWMRILSEDWRQIRKVLLDPGAEGRRRRQNNPFCGVLSPQHRWRIYKRFRHESKTT